MAFDFVKSARLRAMTSAQRQAQLPGVPAIQESGVPDFDVTSWYGVCAPAAAPVALLNKLNADITSVLRMPELGQPTSFTEDAGFFKKIKEEEA